MRITEKALGWVTLGTGYKLQDKKFETTTPKRHFGEMSKVVNVTKKFSFIS